jgi:two-component system cell cycle sensor histidine kinase/response regulator CckA
MLPMTEEQRTAAVPIVLVVDQSELVRLFVVNAVATLGYSATGAQNVDEALQILENPSLRVLICDLSLGPKNGPEFVRKALRNRPQIKVIFIAGHSENTAFRKTDPLLLKPFHLQQLRIAIETVLLDETQPRLECLRSGERRRTVARTGDRSADDIAS